uniref:NADH-ubiquinone oxidoreductase chain 6 n=1 Tax=Eukaryota sp. BB2 TaxID=1949062 RepID=A0A1W5QGU7_9EUKA|nr:NADH dehydrogenase subunit 6 [Eukaryota sp. BB2]AQL10467.1 NADH dehydrogenase subunit 6 [Eukaryota sp. BB2]
MLYHSDSFSDIILFMVIWTISFLSSILMIWSHNPVYSTLFMMTVFIATSVLFAFLGIGYIGLIFLVVYVGAIAILFLFVVMMIPIKQLEVDDSTHIIVGVSFFVILFTGLYWQLEPISSPFNFAALMLTTEAPLFEICDTYDVCDIASFSFSRLGFLIFEVYFPFLYTSGFSLLVAMMGSILLTNEQGGRTAKFGVRKQSFQWARLHVHNFTN